MEDPSFNYIASGDCRWHRVTSRVLSVELVSYALQTLSVCLFTTAMCSRCMHWVVFAKPQYMLRAHIAMYIHEELCMLTMPSAASVGAISIRVDSSILHVYSNSICLYNCIQRTQQSPERGVRHPLCSCSTMLCCTGMCASPMQ